MGQNDLPCLMGSKTGQVIFVHLHLYICMAVWAVTIPPPQCAHGGTSLYTREALRAAEDETAYSPPEAEGPKMAS